MKTITVKIAEVEYTITPLPILASREWRKQFDSLILSATGLLTQVGSMVDKEFETPSEMVSVIGTMVAGNLSEVVGHLVGSADIISQAVFSYSETLRKDKERIEAEGYDEELVTAFIQILSLAFPFGSLLQTLMKAGPELQEMVQSSASASLEDGTMSSNQES